MKQLIFTCLFFLTLSSLNASHNRSGEILYKRIAPFTQVVGGVTVPIFTYSITLIKYTGFGQQIAYRCADTIYFGDGNKAAVALMNGPTCGDCTTPVNGVVPTCGSILVASYNVKQCMYSTTHTYPGYGIYVIHCADPNRSAGSVNMPNSDNQVFYTESKLIIDPLSEINSSPVLTNPPTDKAIVGTCFYHNPGAYDPDGDSLSYEMTVCKNYYGQTTAGYSFPAYGSGPGAKYDIDAISGLLTWCNPQAQGAYNIAFVVKEWRKGWCTGNYYLIGAVTRDMEIIVGTAPVQPTFSSQGSNDICVVAGNNVSKTFTVSASTSFNVGLYGYASHSSSLPLATVSPSYSSQGTVTTVNWQTNCSHIKKEPHKIVMAYRLNSSPVNKIEYNILNVRVVPPAPKITSVVKDTSKVTLKWQTSGLCLSNQLGYHIYRKIGTNTWTPPACQPGIGVGSGFTFAGFANAGDSTFTDYNLWTVPNGSTGNYIVTAVMKDCSESLVDGIMAVTLIVGLNDQARDLNAVKVYPNPASDKLIIETEKAISVNMYNALGQLVQQSSPGSNPIINVSELTNGVYTLQLKYGTTQANRKIVIKH